MSSYPSSTSQKDQTGNESSVYKSQDLNENENDNVLEKELDPNIAQSIASHPENSVWVSASAGTGKTKVLTDRVLRLLLPRENGQEGTPAHKILCLTFTKSGAGEMSLRISKKLSSWAVIQHEDLYSELQNLLRREPSSKDLEAARRLFAQVVDNPSGLKIMTIHSFCQSVLARFPLEAQLSPHFHVMEERQAQELLIQARDKIIGSFSSPKNENFKKDKTADSSKDHIEDNVETPIKEKVAKEHYYTGNKDIHALASILNENSFIQLVQEITKERRQFFSLYKKYQDEEGFYQAVCMHLNIQAHISAHDTLVQACDNQSEKFDFEGLMQAKDVFFQGTKTDQNKAMILSDWLEKSAQERAKSFDIYKNLFLTKDNKPRSKLTTKKSESAQEVMEREMERICMLHDTLSAIACAQYTKILFSIGRSITKEYQSLKSEQGALDYDDLINNTLDLLNSSTSEAHGVSSMSGWVHYKLDQGLDHILIDEAQDTNPEQWQIIAALCDDFFSGEGAQSDIARTVFSVGDEKQSIYSFQRAAPDEFNTMQNHFLEKVETAGRKFKKVPMSISFRSTKSVLDVVDSVFSDSLNTKHHSYRRGQAGSVELWPLCRSQKIGKEDPWQLPIDIVSSQNGAADLAEQIALSIKSWLQNKTILPSKNRPIEPRDILILVRSRGSFTAQLMRAIKSQNIPISGADRMVLSNQLVIEDLLSLAHFALLPGDDLNLACILKSPIIGLSEEELYHLAIEREGTLWEALPQGKTKDYLISLREMASYKAPFEFFSHILQTPCPADEKSGMRAFKKRLGHDVVDSIEEFLASAISFEQNNIPSLQNFVHFQEKEQTEIKREFEDSENQVRIMTVHGAKGLQAPIVFLPDTTTTGKNNVQISKRLLWPHQSDMPVPLWSPYKDIDCALFKKAQENAQKKLQREYERLLYVALTRAEDQLYIAGYTNAQNGKIEEGCWYELVKSGMEKMPNLEDKDLQEASKEQSKVLMISNPQTKEVVSELTQSKEKEDVSSRPLWLETKAPKENKDISALMPSKLGVSASTKPSQGISPLNVSQNNRFLKGTLMHKMLEYLPNIASDKRQNSGEEFLRQHGKRLSEESRRDMLDKTLAIINNPEFERFFASGSLAEVSLAGFVNEDYLMSGQVDRLLITDTEIWIIDYKTNKNPPIKPEDIPEMYKNQMNAYKEAFIQIYPSHNVHAALLWTENSSFMILE